MTTRLPISRTTNYTRAARAAAAVALAFSTVAIDLKANAAKHVCPLEEASPGPKSLYLRLALDLRIKLIDDTGKGFFDQDVSDIVRPLFLTGISLLDVDRTLCGLGVSSLTQFRGSTEPGQYRLRC